MQSPRLSVIVPIYNTGAYLKTCLDALCAQTLRAIEIILVDDGSSDATAAICDDYAQRDQRVRVFHKQNEGVSIARNAGLAAATGEYIGFADSDDWPDPTMYAELLALADAHDAAIVMCDAVSVFSDGRRELDTIPPLAASGPLAKAAISPALLKVLAGSAWRCIYRAELLRAHAVRFPTGLRLSEDRVFNVLAFGHAGGLYYDKTARYNRLIRAGSAANRYYDDLFQIALDAQHAMMAALDAAWDGQAAHKRAYEANLIDLALRAIYNEFNDACTRSLKDRYQRARAICDDPELRRALASHGASGLREQLLQRRQASLLCVAALLFNLKNGGAGPLRSAPAPRSASAASSDRSPAGPAA